MTQKEQQWNSMLKLKQLPYGSIHPVSDTNMDLEVQDIISSAAKAGCLDDLDIHNKFLQQYQSWIVKTKNNKISGLELFPNAAFSNGTTEAFDKFYLKYARNRLRYFRGEYMYHTAVGKHYFREVEYLDDSPIESGDVVVMSFPFANTGGEHVNYKDILHQCNVKRVPVLIDCAYINIAGGLEFDFDYNCIEEIVFSLSKAFPVGHLRIGMRLTRDDNDDPLFVYNKNRYVNRLGAAVGLELINRYGPDHNFNTYRNQQLLFCDELGVEPSPTVVFGTSATLYPEYNRGGEVNRLCFSKFLKNKKLP
jgi:hypothetical protein